MNEKRLTVDRAELPVPRPAPFQPLLFVLAILVAGIVGYVVGGLLPYAWTGIVRVSPFLFTSLIVGWFLGSICLLFVRIFEIGNRLTVTVGFWLVVIPGVLSPHRIAFDQSYEATLRQIEAESRQVSHQASELTPSEIISVMTREMLPDSIWDFLNRSAAGGRRIGPWTIRDGWVWASWVADSLALVLGAIVGARYTTRLTDFCGTCGRFYRRIADGRTTVVRIRCLIERYDLPAVPPDSDVIADDALVNWCLHACPGTCGNGVLRYDSEQRRRVPPTWFPGVVTGLLTRWFPPVLYGKIYLDPDTTVAMSLDLRRGQPRPATLPSEMDRFREKTSEMEPPEKDVMKPTREASATGGSGEIKVTYADGAEGREPEDDGKGEGDGEGDGIPEVRDRLRGPE
ncbi:MAG: hypothetical protein Q4C47_03140 [Planctomycetia bacterium]|nr:hypothetical protein [Planctomycetia bacterium]